MSAFAQRALKKICVAPANVARFAERATVISRDPGGIIVRRNEHVAHWSMVISGLVVATVPGEGGREMPLNIYGINAWFGEQSIINQKATYLQYEALSDTELLCLRKEDFLELITIDPEFSMYVTRLMAWRVEFHSNMLMLMRAGSAHVRVVMGLAQLAEALATQSARPPTIGLDGGFTIPVKQAILARLCGVSRGVFSDCIQELERSGWVLVSYGTLELKEIDAWRRFMQHMRAAEIDVSSASIQTLLKLLSSSASL